MSLLQFHSVTLVKGLRVLIQDASFAMPSGSFFCLRGENGAGKTSLLRAAANLSKPLSGTIERQEGALSFLGHELALKPYMTAAQVLSEDQQQAWHLEALADLPLGQLSAGQVKRVALAQRLRLDRALWLLDEPMANLDPAMSALVLARLQAHAARGGAVLASAHHPMAQATPLTLRGGRVHVG